MRHTLLGAGLVVLAACGTKSERSKQPPPAVKPPSSGSAMVDAAAPPAESASLTPCVVRAELSAGRVTFSGGGISGSDVTALRSVAKTCTARLVADDDVAFEEVTRVLGLIAEQGIDDVRLGEPLGQWMSMDLAGVTKLWKGEPAAKLLAALKDRGSRLGDDNATVVQQVVSAIGRARQDEPIGKQTSDRGIFEAVAQIVGLRRATAPVAVDLLEQIVMPALQIDAVAPVELPSLGASKVETGVELFEMFVARATKRAVQNGRGLLGAISDADVSTPYADDKALELGVGDWVVVAAAPLAARLDSYDERVLVAQYDRFVGRLQRRDNDRVLVEMATRALADLRGCVAAAVQNREALVFRYLPAPIVTLSGADDRNVSTVVITKTAISVQGERGKRSLLSSLPETSPRTIVIEAERTLAYGRIRAVAAAIGSPGQVTFVLRHR